MTVLAINTLRESGNPNVELSAISRGIFILPEAVRSKIVPEAILHKKGSTKFFSNCSRNVGKGRFKSSLGFYGSKLRFFDIFVVSSTSEIFPSGLPYLLTLTLEFGFSPFFQHQIFFRTFH